MPYDFAVEHQGQFVRVRVKSAMFKDRGGYCCTVRGLLRRCRSRVQY